MKILGENGIGKFLKVFLQICFWGRYSVINSTSSYSSNS